MPGSEDDHIILARNTFGKDYRSKSIDRLLELFQTSLFSQRVIIRLSDLVISHLFFKDLWSRLPLLSYYRLHLNC